MSATLADLKSLRTTLLTSSSEMDENLKELESAKEENAKLKYRIKHLVRSLEAEEDKFDRMNNLAPNFQKSKEDKSCINEHAD